MIFSDFIQNKKVLYPSLGILLAILLAIAFFVSHNYTILTVNGESVSQSRFTTNYRAAKTYYKNFKDTYAAGAAGGSATSSSIANLNMTDAELKAGVLTQLIEGALVSQGAKKEVGDALSGMIKERTDKYANNPDLAKAARTLYGINENAFLSEVLMPQANADILRGRLFLKAQSFDDWLKDEKKNAQVQIFSEDFTWNGDKVAPK